MIVPKRRDIERYQREVLEGSDTSSESHGPSLRAASGRIVRLLSNWSDIPARDRALVRLLLDLEDLIDATGSEVDASWFDWAKTMANDVRAYLIGKGVVL